MSRRVHGEHRAFAKSQRAAPSQAERVLWEALRAARLDGWKFKRQIPLGPYVVDFICFDAKLIVESDGPLHESEESRLHDARRDSWLRAQGFTVLRLPNDLVLGSPELAVASISETLAELSSRV